MKLIDNRNNCFNLIRLYACVNVLLYHMDLYMDVQIPILGSLVNPINGVPVFFLLSGFLIWFSIERTPDFSSFCTKRILRLYPELWFSIILQIICLLFFYKGASIKSYIAMIITHGSILQFHSPNEFDNYGIGSLNVSLWTVPIIVQFYVVIWFLYKWLKIQSMKVWLLNISIWIGFSMMLTKDLHSYFPTIVKTIIGLSVINYLWIFLIGCFIAKFFNQLIPLLSKYWYISLLSLIAYEVFFKHVQSLVPYSLTGTVLLALTMFGLAYKFYKFKILPDISYPVYLYHMIFANVFIQLGYKGSLEAVLIIITLSFISAYISTKFIYKINNQLAFKPV